MANKRPSPFPIGWVPGYAGGINLYAYCGNEPINGIDPLGLCNPGQAGALWYDQWHNRLTAAQQAFDSSPLGQFDNALGTIGGPTNVHAVIGLLDMPYEWGHLDESTGAAIDYRNDGKIGGAVLHEGLVAAAAIPIFA